MGNVRYRGQKQNIQEQPGGGGGNCPMQNKKNITERLGKRRRRDNETMMKKSRKGNGKTSRNEYGALYARYEEGC